MTAPPAPDVRSVDGSDDEAAYVWIAECALCSFRSLPRPLERATERGQQHMATQHPDA